MSLANGFSTMYNLRFLGQLLVIYIAVSPCNFIQLTYPEQDPAYRLPVVRTSKGEVQGSVIITDQGNVGYGFQGIPYAASTAGSNRFMPPKTREPWEGVLNATQYAPKCWQLLSLFDKYLNASSSEDCLTLNIFTPVQNLSGNKDLPTLYPVVYYILGGNWQNGDSGMYPVNPMIDTFVSRGVIIIFVNFRINVFGSFTTGSSNAPGNMALRDMIAGLQWVQDEIRVFGGDPAKVTLQGASSGGEAVSLLTLSPLTEGLFHQAVPMSGTRVYSNSLQSGEEVGVFFQLAYTMGCNEFGEWYNAQDKMVSCMQEIDPVKLSIAYAIADATESGFPRIDGAGGVLPEDAITLSNKRRPYTYLMGTTAKESVFTLALLDLNGTINASNFDAAVQSCKTSAAEKYPDSYTLVAQMCEEYYQLAGLKQEHPDADHMFWFEERVKLLDGNIMFATTFSDVDTMRKAGSETIYLYSFDYVKKGLDGLAPWHAMDLWHIFNLATEIDGVTLGNKTTEDLQMDKIYSTIFTNFAKHGDPTSRIQNVSILFGNGASHETKNETNLSIPEWQKLTSPIGFNYYSINLNPQNKPFYHYEDVVFWNNIAPSLATINYNVKQNYAQRMEMGNGRTVINQLTNKIANKISINNMQFNAELLYKLTMGSSNMEQPGAILHYLMEAFVDDKSTTDFIKAKEKHPRVKPSTYLVSTALAGFDATNEAQRLSSGIKMSTWVIIGSLLGVICFSCATIALLIRSKHRRVSNEESEKIFKPKKRDKLELNTDCIGYDTL